MWWYLQVRRLLGCSGQSLSELPSPENSYLKFVLCLYPLQDLSLTSNTLWQAAWEGARHQHGDGASFWIHYLCINLDKAYMCWERLYSPWAGSDTQPGSSARQPMGDCLLFPPWCQGTSGTCFSPWGQGDATHLWLGVLSGDEFRCRRELPGGNHWCGTHILPSLPLLFWWFVDQYVAPASCP